MLQTAEDIRLLNEKINHSATFIDKIHAEIGKIIIGQYHMVAVFFLYIPDAFAQCIGMYNIGGFYTMQYHIHDADDIGQVLLFLAVKGVFL